MFEFESRIAGIHCIISVDSYTESRGSYSYNASSDWDYYGYSESEWTVLDRKGYKADWLARKLTSKDCDRIEGEIADNAKSVNRW